MKKFTRELSLPLLFSISLIAHSALASDAESVARRAVTERDFVVSSSLITYEGSKPTKLTVASGFGKQIALTDVIKLIAPPAVTIAIDDDVGNAIVSWQGGDLWTTTLADVLRQAGATATLNFDTRKLHVGRLGSKKQAVTDVPATPAKLTQKSGIVSIVPEGDLLAVSMASQVKEIYVIDADLRRDVLVKWTSDMSFKVQVPAGGRLRISTDTGSTAIDCANHDCVKNLVVREAS